MDDSSFGLSEAARVLRLAGVRHLLPAAPRESSGCAVAPTADHGQYSLSHPPLKALPLSPVFNPDWAPILAKLPQRPLALITYLELGADLTGAGDPVRSALWRRMIAALTLPKGSLGFLPFAFHQGDTVHVFSDAFATHFARYAPRLLLVFGPDAFAAAAEALGGGAFQGTPRVRECPSPDVLSAMDAEHFAQFCDVLRREILSLEEVPSP